MTERSALGKVIVVQPAFPAYRIGFFNRLAQHFGNRFVVYASLVNMGALTPARSTMPWERRLGSLHSSSAGLGWQVGAVRIPLSRNDVLVVSGNPRNISTVILMLRARAKGAAVVWWGHYRTGMSRSWRHLIRLFFMRISTACLFYTDNEAREYRSIQRSPSHLIFALNNGLDTAPVVRLRQPYRAADRPRSVLFIGRITEKANLQIMLSALRSPKLKGVQLEVIGGGRLESRMRAAADQLAVSERVAWHGGSIDEAAIAAVANRCRLFVYPGSVGLSLIHAMAYGLPAVLHDDRRRHMPEIAAFEEGATGVTFARGDAEALCEVIAASMDDAEALDRMSAKAVAVTSGTFNAEDMTFRFCTLVEALRPEFSRPPFRPPNEVPTGRQA